LLVFVTVALAVGLLANSEARRRGEPSSNAKAAIILGGVGTCLLVVGSVASFIRQHLSQKSPKTPASASVCASAASAPSEADVLATKGRIDRAVATARQLFMDRDKIDAEFAAVDHAVTAVQLSTARKGLDSLSDRFAGLDPTYLVPEPDADASAREQAPTPHDQAKLFASVGKYYGLSGKEVQEIYDRNAVQAYRREQANFTAKCGTKPLVSQAGELVGAKEFVQRTANDPDSIQVSNCSDPVSNPTTCWSVTCDVRGKNAFNALILKRTVFALKNDEITSAQ